MIDKNCTDCMAHMSTEIFQQECERAMVQLYTAILIFDVSGKLRYANDSAQRILQEGKAEIESGENSFKQFMEFLYVHADDSGDLSGNFSCVQGEDGKVAFHDTIILESGRCYLVQFIESKGQSIVAELSDVTHLLHQREHLRFLSQEKDILLEAIQTSQKGILIADLSSPSKSIVFCNHALLSLIGMRQEELRDENITDFFFALCPENIDMLKDIIEHGGKGEVWKCLQRPDGDLRWLEIRVASSIGNIHGKKFLTCYISDQTKMRMQQERLQQAQKLEAIGQLAGGIAHDFNNVLSIIDGFARLSESGLKRGEIITEHLQKIRRAVARATGITRQLLLFGRHRVTENKTHDAAQIIAEAEMLLAPLLRAGIHFNINLPDRPLWVEGSHDAFIQILMNLVINACDAMAEDGSITISAAINNDPHGKNQIIITVTDTGSGMTPEICSRIFEPFFTTKAAGKGTGLGLTQVYGLISQMNGHITVDTVLGKGTTFVMQFPAAEAPAQSEGVSSDAQKHNILSGKTILIAEDEPDLRDIMAGMVAEWGMEPICAADGIEALEMQDNFEGKIDVLLTDMVMPRLGGAHMARLFKEVRPETQVLYVSGYPEKGDIEGVDVPDGALFFAKPIERERLQNDLVKMLSGKLSQSTAVIWQG